LFNENVHLNVSYDFSKLNGFQEIQCVMFLVMLWIVSPFGNVEPKENADHGISLFFFC
jgi:hypothetical protein